jgi:capsular exopolysaccharide synthesis family protein
MSRIQNILEKAEREGNVRRVRPMPETVPATALAYDTSSPMSPVAEPEPPSETEPALSARTVRDARFDRHLVVVRDPGSPAAEQYRAISTRIMRAERGSAVDVVLLTSPGRGEGKSLTAANLALTMGRDFQTRVCVVDANLRHPGLHGLFGVADTPGLGDVLTGAAALADALVRFEDEAVVLLPAGHPASHPAELLGSSAMRRTIETLRTQFDRVIIDAPAAGPLADVGILAPLVDGVLLVVQAGVTTKPSIQEAVSTIPGEKFLGVVLNGGVA